LADFRAKVEMFHVKHQGQGARNTLRMPEEGSLSDTEVAENHVEHVFYVNPARQATQCASGEAELFGDDVLAARRRLREGTIERSLSACERLAVTLAGDEAGL